MKTYQVAVSTLELDGKLPDGDPLWPAFNASFECLELTAVALAWLIDEGRAFTTPHAHAWRKGANFLCGQHLGLDFDAQSAAATQAHPFVAKHAAIVYATPSSTPAAPRSRAVFLLDQPIRQAPNYVRAATALIWAFGGEVDRKCKDACRFFYGAQGAMPTRLPPSIKDSPEAWAANELPLATVKELIGRHEDWQRTQARPKPATYTPRTTDAKDAADLLLRLAPSRADEYEDWLAVGMALSTLGDEGLGLWEAWSSRSAKHVQGECERKWHSFRGAGVTMATVAHWARQDSPR